MISSMYVIIVGVEPALQTLTQIFALLHLKAVCHFGNRLWHESAYEDAVCHQIP